MGVYSCMGNVDSTQIVHVPFGFLIPAGRPNVLLKRPYTHQLINEGHDHALKVGYNNRTLLGDPTGFTDQTRTRRLEATRGDKSGPPFKS